MTSTIGEILPVAARRFGTRTALIVGDRSFSFEDLQTLSDRAAHGLVLAGVQPGDRVALYGPNCWEWLVAYYGIAKTGAVVIPINVMLTPDVPVDRNVHDIRVRATDGLGHTQLRDANPPFTSSATGYHRITIAVT